MSGHCLMPRQSEIPQRPFLTLARVWSNARATEASGTARTETTAGSIRAGRTQIAVAIVQGAFVDVCSQMAVTEPNAAQREMNRNRDRDKKEARREQLKARGDHCNTEAVRVACAVVTRRTRRANEGAVGVLARDE
jgi:hypothetical protein